MKINSYKQNDIKRITRVYNLMGDIINRAASLHSDGNYAEWLIDEMPEFVKKYPFQLMPIEQRKTIKQQLHKINIQDLYGEDENQSNQDNSSHRDNTKYIIIHCMWSIYEQFLLASIHPTTAEIFLFCGLEVNQDVLNNILNWYKVTAAKYGFISQYNKSTRIRPRSKWSEESKARHSILMAKINQKKNSNRSSKA